MKSPSLSQDHHEAQESTELVLQRWMSIQHRHELVNRVAHDLVQPLSDIVNRVWVCRELSKRNEDHIQLHESLTHIENCALRVVEMIRMAHKLTVEHVPPQRPTDSIEAETTTLQNSQPSS